MSESKEELKSLLMKVKEETEKSSLKLNIQITKIMASLTVRLNNNNIIAAPLCRAAETVTAM